MENLENLSENSTSNSTKKKMKKYKSRVYNSYKKNSKNKTFSDKSLSKFHHFEKHDKISLIHECQSHIIASMHDPNYKKDLNEKYHNFLDKAKFKLSNAFDEKNSKKFLNKKDKYLKEIILSDVIENENNNNSNLLGDIKEKLKYPSHKNINNYFIIITDYDEEKKSKNTNQQRKSKFNRNGTSSKDKKKKVHKC
jgi:hypothetical protein